MGIRGTWDLLTKTDTRRVYPASPWTEGQLQTIVWSDIYDAPILGPLTRTEAMTVPAMNKARNLICPAIARLSLWQYNADGRLPVEQQPTWLYRTDAGVSPFTRMCWTLDDLLFFGASLWSVDRGSERQITFAERVPIEWWHVDNDGAILIHDEVVEDASSVLYFPSHTEGLLDVAGATLRAARDVDKSVARRASSPVPVMEIHHTDPDTPINETEAKAYVTGYNQARRDPEGATVFTPPHVELKPHGANADSGAMVEARNAIRLDVANLTNLPAALLDGSVAAASLTYVTTEGKKSELVELTYAPWIADIQGRLSLDDVVPRGSRVLFDQTELQEVAPTPVGATETRD